MAAGFALLAAVCPALATPAQNTLVAFNTTAGTIEVDLFDQVTPQTVAKILGYINTQEFDNSIIHRMVKGFVVQGGGYKTSDFTRVPLPFAPTPLSYSSMIPNEFRVSNTVGTIAMAQSTGINSATTQWFFNTVSNTFLDTSKFTVFGQVVHGGMSVINTINNFAVSDPNFAGDTSIPHYFSTTPNDGSGSYVSISNITIERTHAAFQNPYTPNDVDNNGTLSSSDALNVIHALIVGHGPHTPTSADIASGGTYQYIDVTGDGLLTAQDALAVIHALIVPAASASPAFSASESPFVTVPEPSSCALAASAGLILSVCALRRRVKRAAR